MVLQSYTFIIYVWSDSSQQIMIFSTIREIVIISKIYYPREAGTKHRGPAITNETTTLATAAFTKLSLSVSAAVS
jgi:hypothetical protein